MSLPDKTKLLMTAESLDEAAQAIRDAAESAPASNVEQDTALTLAYVNGARLARGEAPLEELPQDNSWRPGSRSSTCPVAKALPGNVEVTDYYIAIPGGGGGRTPGYVSRTIKRFDRELDDARIRAGKSVAKGQ